MLYKKLISSGMILSSVALFTACGGSSGSATNNTNSATTTGAITAFGSIFVNGKEIETGKASIYIEGKQASESDLRVGMVVTVTEDSNGTAVCINHDDDLEGLVISNSIAAGATTGSMNIMGQDITIDENTVFESNVNGINTYSDVVVGNIVEVSGYSAGMGEVTATRFEVKAADLSSYSGDIELKGMVSNQSGTTFDIGMLTVDYAGAILEGMASITNGMYVEVKSTQGLDSATGNLVASKVEQENGGVCGHQDDEDDEFEVHGKVVAVSDTSVTVDGYTFILNDNTDFEDGNKADVKVGVMLEVEGYYNSDNLLVAKQVEIEEYGTLVKFTDTISVVNPDGTNSGMLTLQGGQKILVNSNTVMHDDSTADEKRFNITYLTQGDTVEVYCFDNGDGTYTATKIERQ